MKAVAHIAYVCMSKRLRALSVN